MKPFLGRDEMDKNKVLDLAGVLASLIIQFGIPAAILLIQGLGKDEITDEDIQKLKALVKPPETYFPGVGK